ncbi:hypothetical protein ABH940_003177 [Streptacidiphilus sp. BW17]|uniref:hypothetical protein n=1 Tax=unclassified Streptacidiphilus TaxID=2643834 RepID=UPI003517C130
MPTLLPERTADDAADSALVAVRAYISANPGTYQGEPADPESVSVIIRDMITSLLHLADATGVPGDREELARMAYCRYREEAAYERLAGFDSP